MFTFRKNQNLPGQSKGNVSAHWRADRRGRQREPSYSGRELLAKYRRVLATGLAMLAVGTSLVVLAPEREELLTVVVAGHDLPAGTLLSAADLKLAQASAALLPGGGFSSTPPAEGSRLAIPALAGTPVLETMLIGPGLLAGTPPGTVAVPVRLNDAATAALLRAGQHVDVVLTEGNGFETKVASQVLARSAAILWTAAQSDPAQGALWESSASGDDVGLIVVAAAAPVAESLAAGSQRGKLSVVLVN